MTPAERARLVARLAAAELRRDSLRFELSIEHHKAGYGVPDLEVAVLDAEATVLELQEALQGASAAVPAPVPAPTAAAVADEYVTTAEAAAMLGVTVKGLEKMRAEGRGPAFVRVGRAVRYRRGDLTK